MPNLRNYHLFISHSWDYSGQYETIREWLNRSPYFLWTDYSVPITKPVTFSRINEQKQNILNRISLCSCVIILSGMYVAYSDWIDFEINAALSMRKPIIGVKPWGQERIPTKVQNCANILIGWNSASVVDAVRQYAL